MARPGIEPRTPDLRVRCPTDCATRPGIYGFVMVTKRKEADGWMTRFYVPFISISVMSEHITNVNGIEQISNLFEKKSKNNTKNKLKLKLKQTMQVNLAKIFIMKTKTLCICIFLTVNLFRRSLLYASFTAYKCHQNLEIFAFSDSCEMQYFHFCNKYDFTAVASHIFAFTVLLTFSLHCLYSSRDCVA